MPKRIASLWFPRLATDRLDRQRGGRWRDRPLAVVAKSGERLFVVAVNRLAEEAGVAPDMVLADARTLCPRLDAVPADPRADMATLHRLARWCERYTPWTAVEGADGLFLDITGGAHLFGGEHAMLAEVLWRIERLGFAVRGAIADTPGAAWALSHYGKSGTVLAPRAQNEALAPLPVAALRLDAATMSELGRLGLRRIGDLYPLPRATLAARFGQQVAMRLDQALARIAEPISPLRPAAPYRVRIAFPEPIGKHEDIAAALDRLLLRLCRLLEKRGVGGRRFAFTGFRVDHTVQTLSIGTAQPARDPRRLVRLFAEKLDRFDAGFGFETLALEASEVESLPPQQDRLPGNADAMPEASNPRLAALADRLGNRVGFGRIVRYAPVESHMPERAFRAMPALDTKVRSAWRAVPPMPPRPLRLLKRPETLEAVAPMPGSEPGDPPALFRWRRKIHRVRRATGPERLLPEWWHGDGAWNDAPRDYWRIEDERGEHFWIFRQGPLRPDAPGRWFLHGLFS